MINVPFEQGPIPPASQEHLTLANDLLTADPADCLSMFKTDQPQLDGQMVGLFESDDLRGYPSEVRQHLRKGFVVAYNTLALAYESSGPVEFPRVSKKAVIACSMNTAMAQRSAQLFPDKQEIVSGYAAGIFETIFGSEIDPQDICMGSLIFMYGCLEEQLLLPPEHEESSNG